jgi:hypothetical protein
VSTDTITVDLVDDNPMTVAAFHEAVATHGGLVVSDDGARRFTVAPDVELPERGDLELWEVGSAALADKQRVQSAYHRLASGLDGCHVVVSSDKARNDAHQAQLVAELEAERKQAEADAWAAAAEWAQAEEDRAVGEKARLAKSKGKGTS